MARTNMPYWQNYICEIEQLFKEDPETIVIYDERDSILTIEVSNSEKAAALKILMPETTTYDNITININIQGNNSIIEFSDNLHLFTAAFYRNPAFSYVLTTPLNKITYIVFAPKLVQYYTGDLKEANGIVTTLYQEIAKHTFKPLNDVFYCTDRYLTSI